MRQLFVVTKETKRIIPGDLGPLATMSSDHEVVFEAILGLN